METTTTAKRKRPATDIAGEVSASAGAAAVEEVSDAEVEEFYAILRRMRDASRRLCGAGVRPPARAPAWRPSFSWEDFAPAQPAAPAQPPSDDDDDGRVSKEDAAATAPPPRGVLDLNAEPEPDTPSSAPPPAPATPRSARAQA